MTYGTRCEALIPPDPKQDAKRDRIRLWHACKATIVGTRDGRGVCGRHLRADRVYWEPSK